MFIYFEKATKFENILNFFWRYCQNKVEDFFNFFVDYQGIHELWEMKWKIQHIHIHDGKIDYKNKIDLIN
jgi:hypothetical protein